jgi:hypothetical protein
LLSELFGSKYRLNGLNLLSSEVYTILIPIFT